eukprot:TRINITY_DN38917_c0_g1_i1.p1 TRINITY_DN38917_c0_g1~~TRINITY_DN38917_c0_g1_i1.p1  ORF type:complete len:100 (-),score=9.39 TRINITY_DN38917_c0_g1_i1:39-338(-)
MDRNWHWECSACSSTYCVNCGRSSHYKKSCTQFKMEQSGTRAEAEFQRFLLSNKDLVKPCPKCQALIEKDKGCDHMKCTNCGYDFWWTSCEKFDLDSVT